jgi:hypothetical protein
MSELKTHPTGLGQLLANLSDMSDLLMRVTVRDELRVLLGELAVVELGSGILTGELVKGTAEILVLRTDLLEVGDAGEGAGGGE